MAGSMIPEGELEFKALKARGILTDTAKKFRYGVAQFKGQPVQVAQFCDEAGEVVAQKLRDRDKNFTVLGDLKAATPLFGQHLWREGGRKVVVTEGEIDCLSMSQAQGNRWPVVSLPNGSGGARKALKAAFEWLCSFEEIILMFDQDEPGRKAVDEALDLLPYGKVKVAHLPEKDPNAVLLEHGEKALTACMWDAKTRRPDGILDGADLWEVVNQEYEASPWTMRWPELQAKVMGHRLGEIVCFTAGSGIGKSEFARTLLSDLHQAGEKVGAIALEESVRRTAQGFMGVHAEFPFHLRESSEAQRKLAFDETLGSGRVRIYDHWGSHDTESLLSKLRFMVQAEECKFVLLDHLSIVVSGMTDGDERRTIDNLMTELRSLVEELNFHLLLISHLKRPDGTPHEEGGKTSLGQLRGSAAIGQLSDIVVGIERNQQAEGVEKNVSTFRVLKNRFCGRTGIAGRVLFDEETYSLKPYEEDEGEVGDHFTKDEEEEF